MSILQKENCIIIKDDRWSEEKKQKIQQIANIDNIVFDVFSKVNSDSQDFAALPLCESYVEETDLQKYPEIDKLQVIAGSLWINRKKFSIEEIDVSEMNINLTIKGLNEKKKTMIENFVEEYKDKIQFSEDKEESFKGNDLHQSNIVNNFNIFLNKNYVEYNNMIFFIKNKPYQKNSQMMLPLRDIYEILSRVSDEYKDCYMQWIGGKDKIIEIEPRLIGKKVVLSVVNNNLMWQTPKGNVYQDIEGTIELKGNTIYLPYSSNNTNILLPYSPNNTYDIKNDTVFFKV